MASATNTSNKLVADLNAHIQFLVRTNNVTELDKLNSKLYDFHSKLFDDFTNTLSDDEKA